MNTLDKYMKEQSVSNQSMKDSGIEWIRKIPIDWNIKKLNRKKEIRNLRNSQ